MKKKSLKGVRKYFFADLEHDSIWIFLIYELHLQTLWNWKSGSCVYLSYIAWQNKK